MPVTFKESWKKSVGRCSSTRGWLTDGRIIETVQSFVGELSSEKQDICDMVSSITFRVLVVARFPALVEYLCSKDCCFVILRVSHTLDMFTTAIQSS